jgi:hypothetical protein
MFALTTDETYLKARLGIGNTTDTLKRSSKPTMVRKWTFPLLFDVPEYPLTA